MGSRAARWTFVLVTWIALGVSGYFLYSSQKSIAVSASAVRAVDLHAREADDALADLRVAQQAYVANGQGVSFWMPKVAATLESVTAAVNALRTAATSPDARAAGEQAAAAVSEFAEVDKRARDYIRAGQTLMAGDVIYTEGGQLAAVASRQVEAARVAEHETFDANEAAMRRQQVQVLASAAGVAIVATLLLALLGRQNDDQFETESSSAGATLHLTHEEGIVSHARPAAPQASAPTATPAAATAQASSRQRTSVVWKAAADLATDFGRVRDADELSRLLARAADLMDASGLIVWIVSPATGELRAALAHGYSDAMLSRMPPMPKTADNAAAAACRTGTLQIVLSKPGGTAGAIVAPILGADSCMGAFSAEIKDGGEGSEAVQAVASIVAAHLAGVVAAVPAEIEAAAPQRAAAQ